VAGGKKRKALEQQLFRHLQHDHRGEVLLTGSQTALAALGLRQGPREPIKDEALITIRSL
jgi:hypothetical protein